MITDLANKDILTKLLANHDIMEFMLKLKPDELASMQTVLSWSPAMLARFRDQPAHLSVLHKMWDLPKDRAAFVKSYLSIYDNPLSGSVNILDAFTQGQIESKAWLLDELSKVKQDLGRVWTLCGWIGTLAYMMFERTDLKVTKVLSFDIDPNCHVLADTLNRSKVLDGWRFKASTLDVNNIGYTDFVYDTVKYDGTVQQMNETADTIINTSCDHMGASRAWWDAIPPNKLIVLQNNNWHENDQHNNSVDSLAEFKEMYPMRKISFAGEKELKLYTRYMMIGTK